MRYWTCAALLLVTACRNNVEQAPQKTGNPLEDAAREANLVVDPATTDPTGLFERRHAAGRDAICFVSAGDGSYRFGLVASFGSTLSCQGKGVARHEGARMMLSFDGASCNVGASYDGQSVRIDGRVADGCAALCGPRASISGVGVQRVGWTAADARSLVVRRSAEAQALRPCA